MNNKTENNKVKKYRNEYTIKNLICRQLFDLQFFIDYSNGIEKYMTDEFNRYNNYLNFGNDGNNYLELNKHFNGRQDLGHSLQVLSPDLFRKTVFINIFSFFEKSLNEICVNFKEKTNNKLGFIDMKGLGIDRAKIYLTKVMNINFSLLNKEWEKLKSFKEVRNKLVHNYSEIESNENEKWVKLQNKLKGLEFYSLNHYSEIRLEKGFIEFFIRTLKSFLEKLLEEIKINPGFQPSLE
jgi:hypothetical protein